ncbi:MAG: phosphoribosylamine--glycine ligase [Alicyclobacillaceae bacterium]|nr:phosphoribosylamine--glycine ligase [Alicyclobacillaceae bacterium]
MANVTGGWNIPARPKVLVVGGGAREHALVWKLAQSPRRPVLYAAPGNPGMRAWAQTVEIGAGDVEALIRFAAREHIDLVVAGPELPLSLGLADMCSDAGIRVFGPTRAAAQVETSKAFAKDVMCRAGVPTARYEVFTDAEAAKRHVRACGAPIVVKADGLAAGKGVTVAKTVAEACAAIDDALVGGRFGEAGRRVVVESYLRGTEVSLMCFVDGETVLPMISARDHKRVFDGDEGPNTGGMGAFAPVPAFAAAGMEAVVVERIVRPTLRELAARGIRYQGVLYAGLMMTDDGPYVVEFNARFGDPEAEVVLPLLDGDLLEVLWATAEGRLADVAVAWRNAAAVCVVLAAPGYPEAPRVGSAITMPASLADLAAAEDGPASQVVVFHAGTREVAGQLVTAGGRVLTVTGIGRSLEAARSIAYGAAESIYFEGKHFRRDIGQTLSI